METYITRSDFTKWRANLCKHPPRREPNSVASSYREEEIRLAQLLFPGAQRIDGSEPSVADKATRILIYTSDCTVFGSCLISGPFIARPDVLIRHGAELRVIKVATQGAAQWEWQDVFDDLVFNVAVLETSCPNVEIVPQLLVVLEAPATGTHSGAEIAASAPVCLSAVQGALGGLLEATVADMDRMLQERVRGCGSPSHRGLGETPR